MVFQNNKHVPIFLNEILEDVQPTLTRDHSLIADCTLGGGGHTEAFLKLSPQVIVHGCDIDENAIALVGKRLKKFVDQDRLIFHNVNFTELPEVADGYDAILADLGFSSNQLESEEYGMSFQLEAPLDMRLARPADGPTAWELLAESPESWLTSILQAYGEISGAGRLVKRIRDAIQRGQIVNSTRSLASWMEKNFPARGRQSTHPATTLFQALRIATNDELRVLDQFVNSAILKLRVGGRLLIITFHSLEDRIVKTNAQKESRLKAVHSKALVPTEAEVKSNPRSRSAKLRVYQRVK